MNRTPSSERAENAPPCPLSAWTISASPIANIRKDSTNVLARCIPRPVISPMSLGPSPRARAAQAPSVAPASAGGSRLVRSRRRLSGDQRDDQDGHDVHDLD